MIDVNELPPYLQRAIRYQERIDKQQETIANLKLKAEEADRRFRESLDDYNRPDSDRKITQAAKIRAWKAVTKAEKYLEALLSMAH